ncbi:MAG: TPM domain-containing protein [Oscillospiraceae bacterium]|jgi:uncharacterized protein|nr:TPM domain-containing protein [Oscillospiraceae bacterium]
MKKTLQFFLALALFLGALALPALAADGRLVIDDAELLTSDACARLEESAQAVSAEYRCDVAILTVQSLDGWDVESYAEQAYDQKGFGWGDAKDGVLLLVSMEARDYYILTYGYGNTAFTDYGKELLEDTFLPALSDGDYERSFAHFIENSGVYLDQARGGSPVDRPQPVPQKAPLLTKVLLVLLCSLGPALIFCWNQLSKMKSAKPARSAGNYIPADGVRVIRKEDVFLYRTVVRHKIPQASNNTPRSGGIGGGGGTTVRSSGFSGRGGKF